MVKVRRMGPSVVLMSIVLAACGVGDRDATSVERAGESTEPEPRDVPVPSITNPGGSSPDRHDWQQLWRTTPGTPERRCVDVGAQTDVRSGDFVAGNFASFIESWDGTYERSKLYYIPAAPVPGQSLEVVAELLDDAAPREVTFSFPATSWTTNGFPFYASGTVLPTRGRWRLRTDAGENTGCFELTL